MGLEDNDRKMQGDAGSHYQAQKVQDGLDSPGSDRNARYFADEQAAVEALQAKQEAAARELEEFVEEHTGEEGLLEDAVNDKGKVTKERGVTERLKVIRHTNRRATRNALSSSSVGHSLIEG